MLSRYTDLQCQSPRLLIVMAEGSICPRAKSGAPGGENMRITIARLLAIAAVFAHGGAGAQEFPTKPLRMVVGFSP